jgi:hypothetical protein
MSRQPVRTLAAVAISIALIGGCGDEDQGLAERRAALQEVIAALPLEAGPGGSVQIEETASKGAPGYVAVEGSHPGPAGATARELRTVLGDLGWQHHDDDLEPLGARFDQAIRATQGDAVLQALLASDGRVVIRIGKRDSNQAWTQLG